MFQLQEMEKADGERPAAIAYGVVGETMLDAWEART